jgi:fermentation-respiration switch protein FrsA (DUF1100 family)
VFGFSQGAALTGLLVGMRQARPADPAATIDFDFALMVGGFKNDAPQHAALYRDRFTLPSLHVIGRTDRVIPPHQSQALADQFDAPVVLGHPGGHVVPGDAAVVEGVGHFLDTR